MNNQVTPKITQEAYQKIFHTNYENIYVAPARTNIIGEHLDYNNGLVFPCAISLYVYAYVSKRNDDQIYLYTSSDKVDQDKKLIKIDLNHLDYDEGHAWANYPIGLISILKKHYNNIKSGFNVYYDSKIPVGCGLSSSAAILVLTATFLKDIYDLTLDAKDIIKYTVATEREYIKVNSGVMDEAIITLAKANTCLLLNCDTMEYKYVPFDLGSYQLLVLNTNKHRLLQESKYNERVAECGKALEILKKHYSVSFLTELKVQDLDEIKRILNDDLLYKRVKYVILENQRVLKFTEELQKTHVDMNILADILNQGHLGLKEDYEVSGYHLDLICELSNQAGALASRMTGAGFGGCAIALVKKDLVDKYIKTLKERYYQESGLMCDIYKIEIVGSATKL